jgi:hypothetical protein
MVQPPLQQLPPPQVTLQDEQSTSETFPLVSFATIDTRLH